MIRTIKTNKLVMKKTIFKLFKKKERSIKDIIFDMKKIRADMSNKLKMINNLIIELETK